MHKDVDDRHKQSRSLETETHKAIDFNSRILRSMVKHEVFFAKSLEGPTTRGF